jgi:hypothetical protein
MKTKPLRIIPESPAGVGISSEYINSIINRIEDLVRTAEEQRPIAGDNINISYTIKGAVINAVTA